MCHCSLPVHVCQAPSEKNSLADEEGEGSSTLLDDTELDPDDTGLDETEGSEQEHEWDLDIEPWTDDTDSESEND